MFYPELKNTDIYLLDLLLRHEFRAGAKALDAGCGRGRNLPAMILAGLDVYAIDPVPERIERARERVLSMFSGYDIQKLECRKIEDLAEEPVYDLVVCNAVLHFADNARQFEEWTGKLASVLNTGGLLFLRLVTSHTFSAVEGPCHRMMPIPDGSERFVADKEKLIRLLTEKLRLRMTGPFKTVNVDDVRTMSTLLLQR